MYGRTLALDGVIQFTESDEFIYHEMLVHPVLLSHPNLRAFSYWVEGMAEFSANVSVMSA